jgi:septal ring factor EnvC (AmiA/AmiB activator)
MTVRQLWRTTALAALLLAHSAAAQDSAATQAEIEKLAEEISAITESIRRDESRRDATRAELRRVETRLAGVNESIRETTARIGQTERELEGLNERRARLLQERNAQQERVIEELRSAWQIGGQDELRLLLNQDDPNSVARLLAYHRYFLGARTKLLYEYRNTLEDLASVETRLAAARDALSIEQEELATEQQALEEGRRERAGIVARLDSSIANQRDELAAMEQDRAELEQLLAEIEEAARRVAPPAQRQPFAQARGAMPWPVSGRPSNRFGASRNQGKLRWQGLSLPAEQGTTVQAIHHGRVVYADWLRGSGLLLVIDHGDGFLSLYAHNETLLREVGEWVATGTPISTVGATGGLERPALYFEIRQDGKPVDPAGWCRG